MRIFLNRAGYALGKPYSDQTNFLNDIKGVNSFEVSYVTDRVLTAWD